MRSPMFRRGGRRCLLEPLEDRRLFAVTLLDFGGGAGGVADTGFTGALATSKGTGLVASKLALASGQLRVQTTAGELFRTTNSQDNALYLNLDATKDFTVQTRLTGLPFTKSYQAGGLYVGTSEDNYVKVTAGFGGSQGFELASEANGTFTGAGAPRRSFSGVSTVDLRLVGTAASRSFTAQYRVNSNSDSAWVTIGTVTNNNVFTAASKAGIITTNFGTTTSVTVPFDSFRLEDNVVAPPPVVPVDVALDFAGGAGGISDTGFTGVLATSKGTGLVTSRINLSGGRLNLTTTGGDLWQTLNNQDNALSVPADLSGNFVVETRLAGLPFTRNIQTGGIFIALDENNYLKLAAGVDGGQGVQFAREANGSFASVAAPRFSFTGVGTLDLRLVGNGSAGTVTAYYRTNSSSEAGWVAVGTTTNPVANANGKAGIVSTNISAPTSVTVPFESFTLLNNSSTPPPPPPPPPPAGDVTLDFNGGAGGIANTGFTGVLATSKGTGTVAGKINLSGGKLLLGTTAGDFYGSTDTQDNALDVAADLSSDFIVAARLTGLPFTKNYQAGGIFIALDEDNYLKLVPGYNGGQGLEFAREVGGAASGVSAPRFSFSGISTLDVRFLGYADTKTVVAQYRINSSSDAAWVTAGRTTAASFFTSGGVYAGIVTTNNGSTTATTVPFEFFRLDQDATLPQLTTSSNANATKQAGNQVEPKIAINPTNPNNLVLVASSDNGGGNTITVSRSTDGGKTWTVSTLGGAQDGKPASTNRTDARVAFDRFGNCYVTYIVAPSASEVRVVCGRSSNGGQSFSFVDAAAAPNMFADGPSIATGVDATNGAREAVFIAYQDSTADRIKMVSMTASGLGNWSAFSSPVTVSDAANGNYMSVAVNAAGAVAVTWQNPDVGQGPNVKIFFDIDSDGRGAATFGTDRQVTTTNVGGFDYIPAAPERSIDAEPQLAFDRSGGAHAGRLYLVYTEEFNNESNDTDIMLRYSDDLGQTWSVASFVNDDDTTNSQFIPALSVDPTSGYVGVSWYDARNSAGNNTAELYAAISKDGGLSFLPNVKVSGGVSNQSGATGTYGDVDYGDNAANVFHGGKLIPAWADNSNSTFDNPDGKLSKFDIYVGFVTA